MNNFSHNIKEIRVKKNIKLEDAAALSNLSIDKLSKIEEGECEATTTEIEALSKAYKISIKKLFKKKNKHVYKIRRKRLVGYNRYGLKQGWSLIAIPILIFISLCLMFTPGFNVNTTVSLMKLIFASNNVSYLIVGVTLISVLAIDIIYWIIMLSLGNYARARRKAVNNIMLATFAALELILALICTSIFKVKIAIGGVFTYIVLFANAINHIVLLILMNLEGGEGSKEQVYTYHESDSSGYENKHWYALGYSALSLLSFCLFFTIAYDGTLVLYRINASMLEVMLKSEVLGLFIGAFLIAVLLFNVVYWLIMCLLKRNDRIKATKANNILIAIMSSIICIFSVAMLSYFGVEYMTIGGISLYVALFVTSIYGFILLPIINCNPKTMYVEDRNGLRKVNAVEGQKPGKIMAYKYPILLQYVFMALLVVQLGLSFLDSSLIFVAFISGFLFLLEILFIILRQNSRYLNISTFIYGIIVNTSALLYNLFLLGFSLFYPLNLGGRISLPIVSGAIVLVYACIVFFLKPIRDVSK